MTVPLSLQFRSRFPQWKSRPATSRHPPRCLPLRFHLMPATHHLSSPRLLRNRPHHLSQRASHRSLASHHSRSRRRCSTLRLPQRNRRHSLPLPRSECRLSPRSRQRLLPLPRSTLRRATKNRPCPSYLRFPLSRPMQRNRRPLPRPPKPHPAECRAGFPSRPPEVRTWQRTSAVRIGLTSSSTYPSRSSGMRPCQSSRCAHESQNLLSSSRTITHRR
jgi:hypothetical protein